MGNQYLSELWFIILTSTSVNDFCETKTIQIHPYEMSRIYIFTGNKTIFIFKQIALVAYIVI